MIEGFRYVPQDNYWLCRPGEAGPRYLYADSATSCITVIVTGRDSEGRDQVALCHLSREARFEAFFALIERKFTGGIALYAQGANPPYPVKKGGGYSYESLQNANTLARWVAKEDKGGIRIAQCTLSLGACDPNAGGGCYGIDIDPGSKAYLTVSNRSFALTLADRDPEGGIQALFCAFGIQTGLPSLLLRDAAVPFTREEKDILVRTAHQNGWTRLLGLSDAALLDGYSTTPAHEPPWFCARLRASAEYARDYE